jgi:hypothetical protein
MLVNYFSPLAPVVVLLLSAFVLSTITPRLPQSWQSHVSVRYVLAPALVVLAGLVLLATERSAPVMLSGWHFGTAESGAGLNIGIAAINLPFLLITIILLLVTIVTSLPIDTTRAGSWTFILGAGAILLFVSANQLTLAYTILLFDILLAYHWLVNKHVNLSIARLLLGIFTAGVLISTNGSDTTTLLGLALWLRLGLYPFLEINVAEKQAQDHNSLAYWSFSLVGAMFLVIQTKATLSPGILPWLVIITMLLNGLLAWLYQADTQERFALLTRLVFTQAILSLLLAASATNIITALAFGLALSLAVLWATPQLGQIDFKNPIRFWPYLPALAATLTLIGFPFLLNWPLWATLYPASFSTDIVKTALMILAVMMAMSGLTRYWLRLWHNESGTPKTIPVIAVVVAAVPFLIPGLAPFILSVIMNSDPSLVISDGVTPAIIIIGVTTTGAIGLGYFRTQIITQLNISPTTLIEVFNLHWLFVGLENLLSQTAKLVLRVNVILEGQHYMGWALFTALVGTLIVILMRNF